jgi:hypothetical protein
MPQAERTVKSCQLSKAQIGVSNTQDWRRCDQLTPPTHEHCHNEWAYQQAMHCATSWWERRPPSWHNRSGWGREKDEPHNETGLHEGHVRGGGAQMEVGTWHVQPGYGTWSTPQVADDDFRAKAMLSNHRQSNCNCCQDARLEDGK